MNSITEIEVRSSSRIKEIVNQFHSAFPYLKLNILQSGNDVNDLKTTCSIANYNFKFITPYENRGAKDDEDIFVKETMTVDELEQFFLSNFGCNIAVSRRCGNTWLRTRLTSNWTLKRQNEIGKEIL